MSFNLAAKVKTYKEIEDAIDKARVFGEEELPNERTYFIKAAAAAARTIRDHARFDAAFAPGHALAIHIAGHVNKDHKCEAGQTPEYLSVSLSVVQDTSE